MDYGRFTQQLSKGIEGKITGYFEDVDGCLLYVGPDARVFVPAELVEHQYESVTRFLRDQIRAGIPDNSVLQLVEHEEALSLEEAQQSRD